MKNINRGEGEKLMVRNMPVHKFIFNGFKKKMKEENFLEWGFSTQNFPAMSLSLIF